MTPELKAAVRGLGLTGLAFAALTDMANTTVSGWGRKQRRDREVQHEPIWAWHLVHAWSRHPHLLAEALARSNPRGRDLHHQMVLDTLESLKPKRS